MRRLKILALPLVLGATTLSTAACDIGDVIHDLKCWGDSGPNHATPERCQNDGVVAYGVTECTPIFWLPGLCKTEP